MHVAATTLSVYKPQGMTRAELRPLGLGPVVMLTGDYRGVA